MNCPICSLPFSVDTQSYIRLVRCQCSPALVRDILATIIVNERAENKKLIEAITQISEIISGLE